MSDSELEHEHIFLGQGHDAAERNVWATVALTLATMAIEIVGGAWFGSIALVADGFHMSTHAGALLIAGLAYRLARKYAQDARFTFGTGKFGDLAGFSSAVLLALIALEIGLEAGERLFAPRPIAFAQAIPIAALGLLVNLASAWLLSRGGHGHHGHEHDHAHDEEKSLTLDGEAFRLSIYEDGVPPRFRLVGPMRGRAATLETLRPGGARQRFRFVARGDYLESVEEIPEPHAFEAVVEVGAARARATFEEHAQAHLHQDHNMRAAILHVLADAAVSVLVIAGLSLGWAFGWMFMDPLAALAGALVIVSWSYRLIRDTGAALLDMNPDAKLGERLRAAIEADGDRLCDLHLWRLGPGHLGAILSVASARGHDAAHYRAIAGRMARFSHLTIEVLTPAATPRREVA